MGNLVITERSNGTNEEHYLHKDHLGSPISITNQSGAVVQQFAYDPWGKQTKIYQTSSFANLTYNQPTNRGYTGHEHIRDLNIVHMNGRIYDARIGRFLQADPNIQSPGNFQNYNRYSYVLNNPLSYTDPSGFFFKKIFKKLNKALGKFAPLLGIALLAIPGVGQWAASSWWKAAVFGFATGGVATGTLRGALIGALSGAAFQQIGKAFNAKSGFFGKGGLGHIGTHAATGGVVSVLQGGKFGHGFLSAGLTKALNVNDMIGISQASGMGVLRVVVAATIGGTISHITGGKFKNGAMTAGFAQALNGEQAARKEDKLFKQLSAAAKKRQEQYFKQRGFQWYGKVKIVEGGYFAAGAVAKVDLISEWVPGGKRYLVTQYFSTGGVGVGTNLGASFSDVEFTTPKVFGDQLIAKLFEGNAYITSVSLSFGGGKSFGEMGFGAAHTGWSWSNVGGISASIMSTMGHTVGSPQISVQSCSEDPICSSW